MPAQRRQKGCGIDADHEAELRARPGPRRDRVDGIVGIAGAQRSRTASAIAMAIVDDFEQVAALLRGQWREPPVIEDQKPDLSPPQWLKKICRVILTKCKEGRPIA
jgi:hypothetical protein